MRWFVSVLVLIGLTGVGLVVYSISLPVYTDPSAPGRLSEELGDMPREQRFDEWYARLATYETAHKKLSDFGRGLIAATAGLAVAVGLISLYQKRIWMRRLSVIVCVWVGLWLLRIPFTTWYYYVRQNRFDYPTWGDSVGIPMIQESFSWMVGSIISSVLLRLLLGGRPLPTRVHFILPQSPSSWLRAVLLTFWLFSLIFFAVVGVVDGNEGAVFCCLVASAILVLFLSDLERKSVYKSDTKISNVISSV